MLMYSARKNSANFSDEYSVWKPATSSLSASGRSNGRPVGLADHRGDVDDERGQQDQRVPDRLLRGDDLRGRHRAGVEEHRDEGQAHRDLVGDHLRRGAQGAQQRVGGARGPSGEHDAVDADRGDRQDVEHRDREVGQLQRGDHAEDRDLGTERDDRQGQERGHDGDDRGDEEHGLVGGRGHDVLLEGQLDAVHQALEHAERADPVGPDAHVHPGHDAPLAPDGEQHEDDHAEEDGRAP